MFQIILRVSYGFGVLDYIYLSMNEAITELYWKWFAVDSVLQLTIYRQLVLDLLIVIGNSHSVLVTNLGMHAGSFKS